MMMSQDEPFTQPAFDDETTLLSQYPPFTGLRTSLSYYLPLGDLTKYLNKASSFDSTVDALVVVYRTTTEPVKADKGPKHWFTKLRVTQPGFYKQTTLVQVFRGYKPAVPRAEVGDVMLLRSFQVSAMKGGGAALKSQEGSAWCVFKANAKTTGKRPTHARKASRSSEHEGEEMTGPPAEFGDEERKAVEEMKAWWKETQALKNEGAKNKL
jgi:hypothetical protein